jgi:uncharacterized protein YdcH (DUF465 family)
MKYYLFYCWNDGAKDGWFMRINANKEKVKELFKEFKEGRVMYSKEELADFLKKKGLKVEIIEPIGINLNI